MTCSSTDRLTRPRRLVADSEASNGLRLELREQALEQARNLATNPKQPTAVRETAVSVLIERARFTDEELLRELGRDPRLGRFEPLKQYVVRMDERNERWDRDQTPLE